jgi:hypothetical protein
MAKNTRVRSDVKTERAIKRSGRVKDHKHHDRLLANLTDLAESWDVRVEARVPWNDPKGTACSWVVTLTRPDGEGYVYTDLHLDRAVARAWGGEPGEKS